MRIGSLLICIDFSRCIQHGRQFCIIFTDADQLKEHGFKCGLTTTYIPQNYTCDGASDCADGSDEENCADAGLNGKGSNV